MDASIPVAIVAVGNILKAPAEEFLRKISGPAGEELGLLLRDKMREYRGRNASRAVSRAQEMLTVTGSNVREVPLRTLLPLLEGASAEDDSDLGELWAALLANAADATKGGIPPIFPAILQQLTPFDALALSRLSDVLAQGLPDDPLPPGRAKEQERWGARRSELNMTESYPDQLEAAINTLVALGLVAHEAALRSENGSIFTTDMNELRITALGKQFVAACTPPSRSSASAS
jgi:hypothetical protein